MASWKTIAIGASVTLIGVALAAIPAAAAEQHETAPSKHATTQPIGLSAVESAQEQGTTPSDSAGNTAAEAAATSPQEPAYAAGPGPDTTGSTHPSQQIAAHDASASSLPVVTDHDVNVTGAEWSQEVQDSVIPTLGMLSDLVSADPQFADLGVDFTHKYIVLYSHGEPEGDWQSVLDSASEVGFSVVRVETAYGEQYLSKAVWDMSKLITAAGIQLSSIGANDTYSGIVIGASDLDGDGATQQQIRSVLADSQYAHLPITFESTELIHNYGRQNDNSPYIGGARLNVNNKPNCTTGFALHSSSAHYLVTAAHCSGYANNVTFQNGQSNTIGINTWTGVLYSDNGLDATLIHASNGTHQMYVGGYTSISYDNVTGTQPWAKGMVGCISGSFSGTRCNAKRDSSDVQITYDENFYGAYTLTVNSTTGSQLAGAGDSGAPAFYPSAYTGLAIVRGGTNNLVCDSNSDPLISGTKNCGSKVYLTPINRVADALSPYGIAFDQI